MKPGMDMHFLLVWTMEKLNANVLQGLKVTVSKIVKTLMNVKRRKLASALNVAARILGEAMTAVAVGIFCILGTMIPA